MTESERPLSPAERWFWLIDQLSPANSVVRVRVHGPIGPYRLEDAADALVAQFPLLRAVVVDGPVLTRSLDPHLPVLHRIAERPDEWRTLFDEELATPVDLATAPGRLIDLVWRPGTADEHHDLILTLSHVLLDGRSVATLGMGLLALALATPAPSVSDLTSERALDTRADSVMDQLDITGSTSAPCGDVSRPPVPPADDLIPRAQARFLRAMWVSAASQLTAFVRRTKRLPGTLPPMGIRRTRTVIRTVDPIDTAALRAKARRANVTVNAALAGALAHAVGDIAAPRGVGIAGIGIPIDLRPRLTPPVAFDEPGMYTAVVPAFIPFGRTRSLWQSARWAKRELAHRLSRKHDLTALAAIRYGCPSGMDRARIDFIDRRAPCNVTLSNLGPIPNPVAPDRVSSLIAAGTNPCASALTVVAATMNNRMTLTFCYVETMLTRGEIESLADHMIRALTR
ncbi:phthiocerol/phthiodiolone dimycocerosyl transferase family protein [Nocardia camponoti]